MLVRKLECLRGCAEVTVEMSPKPNYAQSPDRLRVSEATRSKDDLLYQRLEFRSHDHPCLDVVFQDTRKSSRTVFHEVEDGVTATLSLEEGDLVWFVMANGSMLTDCSGLESSTTSYWVNWVRRCLYRGRHQEQVERTMLILKLLTYSTSTQSDSACLDLLLLAAV